MIPHQHLQILRSVEGRTSACNMREHLLNQATLACSTSEQHSLGSACSSRAPRVKTHCARRSPRHPHGRPLTSHSRPHPAEKMRDERNQGSVLTGCSWLPGWRRCRFDSRQPHSEQQEHQPNPKLPDVISETKATLHTCPLF